MAFRALHFSVLVFERKFPFVVVVGCFFPPFGRVTLVAFPAKDSLMIIVMLVTAIALVAKFFFSDHLTFVALITTKFAMLIFEGEFGLVMVVNMFFPLCGYMTRLAFSAVIPLVEVVDLMA